MLDDEIAVAEERLAGRFSAIWREDTLVYVAPNEGAGSWRIRLDGCAYDAEPFRVALVDDHLEPLACADWPPITCPGLHEVLGVPWICVSGVYEFYVHPSHYQESWDAIRNEKRLPDLLAHLLRRCGQ
jgi:hypothetical protein